MTKSGEFQKASSDEYVSMTSKNGRKGYVKADKGPSKHEVSYGRHKQNEKLVDDNLVQEILQDIKKEEPGLKINE